MRECEFFVLRYVPDAVKDEFVNIGVVLVEQRDGGFAGVRFAPDFARVRCLDAGADVEMLEALRDELGQRLREDREAVLRAIDDSFSNLVQVSGRKGCLTEDPAKEIETLAKMYLVTSPARAGMRERASAGRQALRTKMKDAFAAEGVWDAPQMRKEIKVEEYTGAGDPLKIDCGYTPNGVVRMFHAVSLATDPNSAKVLAFSYPALSQGMLEREKLKTELTAIVEDKLDREGEQVRFALGVLGESRIRIAAESELQEIARRARMELRL